jgi:hypothetical protein
MSGSRSRPGGFAEPGAVLDVNDKVLKGMVTRECAKRKRAYFILGLTRPGETIARTIVGVADRIMKYVPKGTKVTIYVREDD